MEISVRFIPTEVSIVEGVCVASGSKPALCFIERTTEETACLIYESQGVEEVKYPRRIVEKASVVPGYEDPVLAIPRFIGKMRESGVPLNSSVQKMFDLALNPKSPKLEPEPEPESQKETPPSLIPTLAKEFKMSPTALRRLLRTKGISAPYDDEDKIRTAVKPSKKRGKRNAKKK